MIYPDFEWWNASKNNKNVGKLVLEEGFEYSSENNKEWLNIEQIRSALKEI